MKNQFHIKPLFSVLSVMVLALLILLSPCKVRNYIQSELDIAQTQALNKSQSAFSPSTCIGFEILTTKHSSPDSDLKSSKDSPKKLLPINLSGSLIYKESKINLSSDYK